MVMFDTVYSFSVCSYIFNLSIEPVYPYIIIIKAVLVYRMLLCDAVVYPRAVGPLSWSKSQYKWGSEWLGRRVEMCRDQ